MRSGLICFLLVTHALHAVVMPVVSLVALERLEVAALELRHRDLLLDELEEQFLLVTDTPPYLSDVILTLL